MYQLHAFRLSALLAGFLLLLPSAKGQEKLPPVKVPDKLFQLYALEDMLRSSAPDARAPRLPKTLPHHEISRFLAERQLLFDRVRRALEKQKADDAILALFKEYGRELQLWVDLKKQLDDSYDKVGKKLFGPAPASGNRTVLIGLGYGLRNWAEGDADGEALTRDFAAMLESFAEEQQKVSAARGKGAKELGEGFTQAHEEFNTKRSELRKACLEKLEKTSQTLKTTQGWSQVEFQHERKLSTEGTQSSNPFVLVDRARSVLAKKEATSEELLNRAQDCQRAAEMVPGNAIYSYYRAAFLGVGGLLANKAAARDLGAVGFAEALKNPSRSGKLAKQIWESYLRSEPLDSNFNDQVVLQYIQSCGAAGQLKSAYAIIVKHVAQPVKGGPPKVRVLASSDPKFWYDCARVCSILKEPAFACECLGQAVKVGFADFEGAKADPDLRTVRENRMTADRFAKLIR